MADNERIPPLDHGATRQIKIGWGLGVMLLGVAYFLGGSFWPFLLIAGGAVIVLWGHFPNLFATEREEQIVAAVPYHRRESPWKWAVAIVVALIASGLASLIFQRFSPQKPDISRVVREAIVDALHPSKAAKSVQTPASSDPPTRSEPSQPPSDPVAPRRAKSQGRESPTVSNPPQISETPILFLDCYFKALPIPLISGSAINVLDIQLLNGIGQFFISSKGADTYWPSPDSFGDTAYQCDLMDYAEEPVFGVTMYFKVSLLDTYKDKDGAVRGDGGKITESHNHNVEISKVEPHGGKYTFYLWNGTGQFAEVTAPEFASLELAKSSERVTVRLKASTGDGRPRRIPLSPSRERMKELK